MPTVYLEAERDCPDCDGTGRLNVEAWDAYAIAARGFPKYERRASHRYKSAADAFWQRRGYPGIETAPPRYCGECGGTGRQAVTVALEAPGARLPVTFAGITRGP